MVVALLVVASLTLAPSPGAVASPAPAASPVPAAAPNGSVRADLADLPEPTVAPDDADEAARKIMSDPKYQPPEETWFDKAIRWIEQKIADMVLSGGEMTWLGYAIAGLFVLALAFFIYRIAITARPDRKGDEMTVVVEPRRDATEWRSLAERHEARGEWKDALRCRYRALVGDLVERDVVRDIAGRTSGEYRIEVAERAPAASAPFSGASDLFDQAWYGGLATGPPENQRFRELASNAVEGAGR